MFLLSHALILDERHLLLSAYFFVCINELLAVELNYKRLETKIIGRVEMGLIDKFLNKPTTKSTYETSLVV